MGEGFVVMQSNDVDIYYYQDEPGKLTHTRTQTDDVQMFIIGTFSIFLPNNPSTLYGC